MIALNSVVVVLMIEALIASLSLAFGFFLYKRTTKNKEHQAADNLVAKLKKNEADRGKKMETLIKNNCDLEPAALKNLLQEIITCERSLYQQVIQIFLNRDVQLLAEMDEYVHNLSEPYCKALEQKSPHQINHTDLENAVQLAQKEIDKLNGERTRLADQLQMAMTTMEEISTEYTRMFNGTKNELALNQSCQKMLKIYSAEIEIQEKNLQEEDNSIPIRDLLEELPKESAPTTDRDMLDNEAAENDLDWNETFAEAGLEMDTK